MLLLLLWNSKAVAWVTAIGWLSDTVWVVSPIIKEPDHCLPTWSTRTYSYQFSSLEKLQTYKIHPKQAYNHTKDVRAPLRYRRLQHTVAEQKGYDLITHNIDLWPRSTFLRSSTWRSWAKRRSFGHTVMEFRLATVRCFVHTGATQWCDTSPALSIADG